MYTYSTKIRVRYADTDQMGYMYYGKYAELYEVGRVEMLRNLGITYKSMEDGGVIMPVIELKCKYLKPALYDEHLRIVIILDKLPSFRIHFRYEVFNERDELINTGETTLVFVDKLKQKPCLAPNYLLDKLSVHF